MCSLVAADFYKSSILWFIYFLYIHATWRNALVNLFFFLLFLLHGGLISGSGSLLHSVWLTPFGSNCKLQAASRHDAGGRQGADLSQKGGPWPREIKSPEPRSNLLLKSLFASERLRLLWSPPPAIRAVALWRPYQTWFVCKTGLPKEQRGP